MNYFWFTSSQSVTDSLHLQLAVEQWDCFCEQDHLIWFKRTNFKEWFFFSWITHWRMSRFSVNTDFLLLCSSGGWSPFGFGPTWVTWVRAFFMQCCFSHSLYLSDIPLDMGVICCAGEVDLSWTMVRSSRATPPPKKNKVTVSAWF